MGRRTLALRYGLGFLNPTSVHVFSSPKRVPHESPSFNITFATFSTQFANKLIEKATPNSKIERTNAGNLKII